MNNPFSNFLFKPRHYRTLFKWKDVKEIQWQDPAWQMKNAIRTARDLRNIIHLNEYQFNEIEKTLDQLHKEGKEALRITPYYASLMQENPFLPIGLSGDLMKTRIDPIFWQSVPTPANLLFPDTGVEGAMDEGSRSFGAAYQRYPNRVALFVGQNTNCASYCVHCQRAKSLDCSVDVNKREIDKGLFYISYNQNINEVLVTGGDALMISQKRLAYVLEELSRISHLRAIRIATRVPVVMPMAITDEILELITKAANRYTQGPPKYVYFMTHINHYQEITQDLADAVKRINQHGFTIRNQTVLLNHVNDHFIALAETLRRMFWIGVHPYYLLQCHKEKGIVHFITPVQAGKLYIKHLQGWISGVTMPRYAANVEGGGGKVLLMPSGHDTMHTGANLDDRMAPPFATVSTWDGRKITQYESLGRSTPEEYEAAVGIMDRFLGRSGCFNPSLILVDKQGKYIGTTHKNRLPVLTRKRKAELLGYKLHGKEMPLTNPAEIQDELEREFRDAVIRKVE